MHYHHQLVFVKQRMRCHFPIRLISLQKTKEQLVNKKCPQHKFWLVRRRRREEYQAMNMQDFLKPLFKHISISCDTSLWQELVAYCLLKWYYLVYRVEREIERWIKSVMCAVMLQNDFDDTCKCGVVVPNGFLRQYWDDKYHETMDSSLILHVMCVCVCATFTYW